MKLALTLTMAALALAPRAFAQNTAADAGTALPQAAPPATTQPDQPGVLHEDRTASGQASAAQAAPPASEAELLALRARIAALEQQVQSAQQQGDQLQQMNDQLAALRGQMSNAEAGRQAETARAAARAGARDDALAAVEAAQAALATGGDDLGNLLDKAALGLSGQARLDLAAAREALSRDDLYAARQALAAAAVHAQQR